MNTSRSRSELLYAEALEHIVGGVNSPSRSFKAVGGGAPVFMKKPKGPTSGMSMTTVILIIWPLTVQLLQDMPTRILHRPLRKQRQMACCTVPRLNLRSSSPKC